MSDPAVDQLLSNAVSSGALTQAQVDALKVASGQSAYLASQLSTYAESGYNFAVQSNTGAAVTDPNTKSIEIGSNFYNINSSSNLDQQYAFATVVSHELGHALNNGGIGLGSTDPTINASNELNGEGTADASASITAMQLGITLPGLYSSDQISQINKAISDAGINYSNIATITLSSSQAQAYTAIGSQAQSLITTIFSSFHPSSAPSLTYLQYSIDYSVVQNAGLSPGQVDWANTPGQSSADFSENGNQYNYNLTFLTTSSGSTLNITGSAYTSGTNISTTYSLATSSITLTGSLNGANFSLDNINSQITPLVGGYSSITANVSSGSTAYFEGSNGNISVDSNTNTTVTSGNTITASAGSSNIIATCSGLGGLSSTADITNAGQGGSLTCQADGQWQENLSGATVSNSGVGSNLAGDNNTDYLSTGTSGSMSGNNNTANLGSNAAISLSGTNLNINVSTDDIIDVANYALASIAGAGTPSSPSGTVINASSGDQISVANHGDTAYGSDATFLVAAGEGELTINGNNDALGDATGVSMANGTFTFNGTGELIEDGGNRVSFEDGSSGIVSGESNTFTLGSSVNLSVDSNLSETVNGSNDTLDLGSDTTLIGLGDNNSINFSGDSSSSSGIYLEFQGYNNSAILSDGFVNFTQGSGNDTIYGSGDTVLNGTGVSLTVDGSNDQIGFNGDPSGGGGATIGINGGGESINASFGETFDFGQNSSGTISGAGSPSDGSGDVINASAGDQIAVANHGDTAFASDDTFLIAAGEGELTINGSNVVVGDAPGIGYGTLTLNGSDFNLSDSNDTFTLDGNTNVNVDGTGDVLYSDNNSIVGNSGTNFSLYGDGDTVILYENSTMRLGNDQTVYVEGSGITIDGGNGDTIIVDGSNDYVSADYSDIQYNGDDDAASGSGDDVTGQGSDDTYDGYGDSGSSGYGYGGSTESGSGYWGFSSNGLGDGKFVSQLDLNQGRTAATAIAEASWAKAGKAVSVATQGSGIAPSLLEAGHWMTSTVTWSFGSASSSGSEQFSSAIQSVYQVAIEEAFQIWAEATGLTLQQVSDPSTADIQIGWNTFDTIDSGALGYTNFKTRSGALLAGVEVSLEDPSQQGLVAGADGSFTYAQTSTTLEQLALHEIGHALGFAISSDPTSIMYPILSSQNLTLNAQDQAMASALYGGSTSALQSAASALAQAIASFTASEAVSPDSLSLATTSQPTIQLVGAH